MTPRATGLVLVVVGAAATAWAISCGMRPPREYHEISQTEGVDLAPMPKEGGVDAGEDDEEADASPDGPGMGQISIALPWSAVAAVPIATLLGKSRTEIEALHAPVKPATKEEKARARQEAKEGWTRYTANLRIRYDDAGVAIEFEQEVPAKLTCLDAAKWLGFDKAGTPVDGVERCTWSGADGGGDLGGGVNGELIRKGSIFKAFKPSPKTP
jgi:hypothetical protein